jgi:hypothetical protein
MDLFGDKGEDIFSVFEATPEKKGNKRKGENLDTSNKKTQKSKIDQDSENVDVEIIEESSTSKKLDASFQGSAKNSMEYLEQEVQSKTNENQEVISTGITLDLILM